jgi:hypothetical protein
MGSFGKTGLSDQNPVVRFEESNQIKPEPYFRSGGIYFQSKSFLFDPQ